MSRTDLNNQSFARRIRKLETQGAKHSRQLNAAAEQQVKATAADVRAKSVQKRQQLEAEIDAGTQVVPAHPPGWMLDTAASARLQNFQALSRQPQTPLPPAMTTPWPQEQTDATRKRQLGQRFGEQQLAEQQHRRQHDAATNQIRQQRVMQPQSQGRSRGRHDDGIQF